MKRQWKVSGKSWPLERPSSPLVSQTRPGGWQILEDASGVRRRFFLLKGAQGKTTLLWNGKLWQGVLESSEDPSAASGGPGSNADLDFRAQFPGKVRKILVQAGQSVQSNEVLIRVEAMKMEFAITAPVAGKVTAIRVQEGQSLSPGELLLDFQADEPSKKEKS